jgi:hypothetical protein
MNKLEISFHVFMAGVTQMIINFSQLDALYSKL